MSFVERYGPWAVVAGASEGTGRAFARKIASNGVPCILVARRAERSRPWLKRSARRAVSSAPQRLSISPHPMHVDQLVAQLAVARSACS